MRKINRNKLDYLKDYQGIHNDEYTYQDFIYLNEYQNFLYHRALYGLSVYTQEEIKSMSANKRKRIIKVNKRADRIINIWKQQIVNVFVAELFVTFFPKEENLMTVEMVNSVDLVYPKYKNRMSFRQLGIRKSHIISKFIEEGILPKNFYDLKNAV